MVTLLCPEYPPLHGSDMSFRKNGCGASAHAGHVQTDHRDSQRDSVLYSAEDHSDFRGVARQSILHLPDQVLEFFLPAARSFGRVCLMVGNPILAK